MKIHVCLSDSNWIRTHNHLVRKRTLNHLSVRLRFKWMWIQIPLLSIEPQMIRRLLQARSSLTFRQTIERGFTPKPVRDMTITYSQTHLFYEKKII